MFPKKLRGAPGAAALILAVCLAGCSGEDPPGGPATVVDEVCSIAVVAEPASLDAPWTLTGPDGFSQTGNGAGLMENLVPGRYELTWGDVADWVTPEPVVRTVRGTKRARLEGRYTTAAGSYPFTFEPVDVSVENPSDPAEVQYTFRMGSPADVLGEDEEGNEIVLEPGELGRSTDEVEHTVLLQTPFAMANTEVTNGQYMAMAQWALDNGHATIHWDEVRDVLTLRDALDGSTRTLLDLKIDPALTYDLETGQFRTSHPDLPVTAVSWYGAAAFCDWLSLQEGLTRAYDHRTAYWSCNGGDPYGAEGYRLPTEAEWEHACRARTTTAFANGAIEGEGCAEPTLAAIGWFCGNSGVLAGEAASLVENAFNLHDMHGNVWEWCNDLYGDYPVPEPYDATFDLPNVDPTGALRADSSTRVIRGGGWRNTAANCRSARRSASSPAVLRDIIGFRPVRSTLAP